MKKLVVFCMILSMYFIIGCGATTKNTVETSTESIKESMTESTEETTNETPILGTSYIYLYEKDGFGGEFTISILEDGTFSYYEGMFSSHLGMGTWSINGDVITLTEDTEGSAYEFINHFKMVEDKLIFIEEGSTNFLYIKVKDGEAFIKK